MTGETELNKRNSRTKLLTLNDKVQMVLKAQHNRINKLLRINRLIILKDVSLGQKSFQHLKFSCSLSDGNLASHCRMMENEGLITVVKEFENRYPKTSYRITNKGIKLYAETEKYITDLLTRNTLHSKCSGENHD